jgi:hypothetical protein
MIQAIDRLRLVHNERRTVYIFCKIPLDLPVDELLTWKQLIGDRRLATHWLSATRWAGTRYHWQRRS